MEDNNNIVTLVIQHHVRESARDQYESWVKDVSQESQRFKGHLGVNVIRPQGASSSYTVILRFDSHERLMDWMGSETRKQLVQKAQPLLTAAENIELVTGLEYWFTPPSVKQGHAKPFKQFLITFSAIFPLTIAVPWALHPLVARAPFLGNPVAFKFLVALVIVLLMVYVIMPRYTRFVSGWLFK